MSEKFQLYQVSDEHESDWVAASSPMEAIRLATDSGCMCEHEDEYGEIVASIMPEWQAREVRLLNDETGAYETLWQVFILNNEGPIVLGSSVW